MLLILYQFHFVGDADLKGVVAAAAIDMIGGDHAGGIGRGLQQQRTGEGAILLCFTLRLDRAVTPVDRYRVPFILVRVGKRRFCRVIFR